jgi:ribosomal protein S25
MIEDFKSASNIAEGLSGQIDQLLRDASFHYIDGNLTEAWKRLKAICQRIIQLITVEEEKALTDLCNISWVAIYKLTNRANASYQYDRLNSKVMRILQEKGLLLQTKRDAVRKI